MRIAALLLLALALAPLAYAARPVFDGAPLLQMLIDAETAILEGDHRAAGLLAREALQARVPEDIEYYHEAAWGMILEYSQIMERYTLGNTTPQDTYTLERIAVRLPDLLSKYQAALKYYVRSLDYLSRVQAALEYLNKEVEAALREQAAALAGGGQVVAATAEVSPTTVYPGDEIVVTVVASRPFSAEDSVVILKTPAWRRSYSPEPVAVNESTYRLTLRVPDTLEARYMQGENPLLVTVYLRGPDGYAVARAEAVVVALVPLIYLLSSSQAERGAPLEVLLESRAGVPLDAYVALLDPQTGEPVAELNTTIQPGVNRILLRVPQDVYRSVYTLLVEVPPQGRYLGLTFTRAVLVYGMGVGVEVRAPTLVIGPPFRIDVAAVPNGTVDEAILVTPWGERLHGTLEGGVYYWTLRLPWPLVYESMNLTVVMYRGGRPVGSANVTVAELNLASGVALALAASAVASVSAEGLLVYLEGLRRGVAWAALRSVLAPRDPRSLYRRLVTLLSRYTRPPAPHETLREYAARASQALASRGVDTARRLWGFILGYERFLYSREKPEPGELAERFREVEKSLR